MTSQRINPLKPPYSAAVEESFSIVMPPGMPPLNIFRTLGHNPRVLSRLVKGGLLDKGSISVAQRELVILRVCANCKAEYEWGVHVAGFAEKAGFSQEQIGGTLSDTVDSNIWSEEQRLLIQMVDELHRSSTLSDEAWGSLKDHFSEEQLVELTVLSGLYYAVSFAVNGLKIECEKFAPRFNSFLV